MEAPQAYHHHQQLDNGEGKLNDEETPLMGRIVSPQRQHIFQNAIRASVIVENPNFLRLPPLRREVDRAVCSGRSSEKGVEDGAGRGQEASGDLSATLSLSASVIVANVKSLSQVVQVPGAHLPQNLAPVTSSQRGGGGMKSKSRATSNNNPLPPRGSAFYMVTRRLRNRTLLFPSPSLHRFQERSNPVRLAVGATVADAVVDKGGQGPHPHPLPLRKETPSSPSTTASNAEAARNLLRQQQQPSKSDKKPSLIPSPSLKIPVVRNPQLYQQMKKYVPIMQAKDYKMPYQVAMSVKATYTNNNVQFWKCPACLGEETRRPKLNMVCCDACDNWFHWRCVGIKCNMSKSHPWFCKRCIYQLFQEDVYKEFPKLFVKKPTAAIAAP